MDSQKRSEQKVKENKKASNKQAENTVRKETTVKVAPETNIYENNGDGSLSEDTNNAVTNSNRDRAGSVKEDTCSTAVLGNEAQETDLNENTGTGGHESKCDGSLNGDTDMNGGHETNNTVKVMKKIHLKRIQTIQLRIVIVTELVQLKKIPAPLEFLGTKHKKQI